jgi:WD40 repeat protein
MTVLLGVLLSWVASLGAAAQPAKKATGVVIPAEPLALQNRAPLSARTLVQQPALLNNLNVVSWTIETRKHRGYLGSSALSPDGKTLATGGMDGMIHLWDAETGDFKSVLVGHNSYVYGLAFSPDSQTLASAGSFDGTARLWEVHTGMPLRILTKGHKGYTTQVAWSRDGKSLVVAGGESGFITLWDVLKPEPVKTVETGNAITGVVWDKEGKLVAVSGMTIGVQVWDIRAGKTVHTLAVPGQHGTSIAWSLDGKWIAGGGGAKTVVWDAESGKQKKELDTPGSAVSFSPDSDTLAVSSGAGVKLWANTFDKDPKTIPLTEARNLAWAPDGSGLYGLALIVVKWAPVSSPKTPREISVASDGAVQLTPNRPLITELNSASPRLWDTGTGKKIGTLEGHKGGIIAAAWSRDGKLLATASGDKTVRLWDATGKAVRTLTGHEGPVLCVAWADGKTLASGSTDKTVRVWQATADEGKVWRKHKGKVNAVAWSKDGKLLASGDEEQTVLIGPLDADKAPVSIALTQPVSVLAWSGNGKSLAVGLSTGDTHVFTPTGGKPIQSFERGGSPPAVTSLAWAPDNMTLLSGRANHTSQVWQVGSPNALFDLQGMAPITHVGWSANGNAMFTSENDRSVRVFDMPGGQLRATALFDGTQVAIVSATGHYHVSDEKECELVYVVQTMKGQETVRLGEIGKYRHTNKPGEALLPK